MMDLEFQNSIYVTLPKRILVLNKHVMPAEAGIQRLKSLDSG